MNKSQQQYEQNQAKEAWPFRWQLLIRPRHFVIVVVLLALAFGSFGVYLSVMRFRHGPLVDVARMEMHSPKYLVDINTATIPELSNLPGIGPVLASEIVGFREMNGQFTSPEQLEQVNGIGPHTMDSLRPFIAPINKISNRQTGPPEKSETGSDTSSF